MFNNLHQIFQPAFGGFVPQLLSQFDGGVGHIVAAALQTKGIIDQAKILENLTELNSIASLFYLFALAMAIASVAVFGNYRQGIYLLIGPVLYTFMVTTTVETDGTKAKMGDYEIPNSIGRETAFLKHIRVIEGGETKKVSLAYALIDGIATEVVQEITKLLVNTTNRDHLKFVARERALSFLLMEIPTEGNLPLLVSRHHAECSEAIRGYMQAGVDTKKILNSISKARSDADVAKIKASADALWKDEFKMKFGSGADMQIKEYLKSMSGTPGFENVNISDTKDDLWVTCKDVWQWIGASYRAHAKKAFEENYKLGRSEGTPLAPAVNDDVKDAIPEDYLAAHMYKNTISYSSNSQLQAQMFSNSPINTKDLSAAFRDHPSAHARGGYFGMKYFADTIPYIQGLLLYLLTIGFPFFAVLLVMPGKAMNFLMWVSLWVWVKSWDVGFALVLVCKDMFWHVLKHRNNTFDTGPIDWADPTSVYALILNNDPLATQNLYFELTSFLTVSVPFLTAHFCLGATGMFEMFRNSIDQTSQRFRTWEQKSGHRELLNVVEREHPQLTGGMGELFANRALNSQSTGITSSGGGGALNRNQGFIANTGAQDSTGRAIGKDRLDALMSGENRGMIVGATNQHAMMAYNFGEGVVRVGGDEYLGQQAHELSQIDSFERRVNTMQDPNDPNKRIPLPGNAPIYSTPEGYKQVGPTKDPNKTTLEENVPKAVLEKYALDLQAYNKENPNKQRNPDIHADQEITWEKFIEQDAQSRGERVALPHVFRGMPRLEGTVSIEELRLLDKSVGPLEMVPGGSHVKELIAKAEKEEAKALADPNYNKEQITLADVTKAGHHDFSELVNYTGALSGRHYAPQVQEGVTSMINAINLSNEITIKGRVLELGSGADQNLDRTTNEAVKEFLKFLTTVQEEGRPGVSSK